MLQPNISNFITYCNHNLFSAKSLETFKLRLREFDDFLESLRLTNVHEIYYQHLIDFVSSGNPSPHVKKQRVWTIRQFFHFLNAQGLLITNPALGLPYPKIKTREPIFLSLEELKEILVHCLKQADSVEGMRNLIILMMLGFLGLRLRALVKLDVRDVNLVESLVRVREKGGMTRELPLPQILCVFTADYLHRLSGAPVPLFLSRRKKRISERTLQDVFKSLSADTGIGRHLHAHLFRHTAATQFNRLAGIDLTRALLGHRSRKSTEVYVHLNSNRFAYYMKAHLYHHREDGHE
jgi:site-specific recombinase XerD